MKKLLAVLMAVMILVGVMAAPVSAVKFVQDDRVTADISDAFSVFLQSGNTATDEGLVAIVLNIDAATVNELAAKKQAITVADLNAILPEAYATAFLEGGFAGVIAEATIEGSLTKETFFDIVPLAAISDPADIAKGNLKSPATLKRVIADVLTNVDGIKVNGVEIMNGTKLDIGALELGFLKGLPADEAALVDAAETALEFKVDFDFTSCASFRSKVRFVVKLAGTEEAKAQTVAYIEKATTDYFQYDLDADAKTVEVWEKVPAKASQGLVKLLNTTAIDDAAKANLLILANGTVQDIIDYVKAQSVEDAQAILANFDKVTLQRLNNLIDRIQASKYGEKVDTIYDVLVTVLEDACAGKEDQLVSDFYKGNGLFEGDATVSAYVTTLIDLAKVVYAGVDGADALLTGEIELTVIDHTQFNDLAKTTFHVGEDKFDVYFPAGTELADILAVLAAAPEGSTAKAVGEIAKWGVSTDEGATISSIADVTLDTDTDLYAAATVKFVAEGFEVASIDVPCGYELVAEDIPAVPELEGFTAGEWYLVGDTSKTPLGFQVDEDVTFTVNYTEVTTEEETTVGPNPETGVDVAPKSISSMIWVFAVVGIVSVGGVVLGLKKKEN